MKKYILYPDENKQQLSDIDLQALINKGIKGLMIDLDNTLVTWHSHTVSFKNKCWLAEAKQHGLIICLVSNNRTNRVQKIAQSLGIFYYAPALKPFGRIYKYFLAEFYLQSHEVAVIGDQLFTDILGGRRHGMYTILVEPLGKIEFSGTKITRIFEKIYKQLLWK